MKIWVFLTLPIVLQEKKQKKDGIAIKMTVSKKN